MEYADLLIEQHGKVAVIRLNRPKAMNALNDNMMNELGDALYKFDADPAVHVIVLTGSEKVFAAGADIAAMANYTYAADTYPGNYIGRNWEHILNIRKPVIGVVSGYCLGGGCGPAGRPRADRTRGRGGIRRRPGSPSGPGWRAASGPRRWAGPAA